MDADAVPFDSFSVEAVPLGPAVDFAVCPLPLAGPLPFISLGLLASLNVPLLIPSKSSGVGFARDRHISAIDRRLRMSLRKTLSNAALAALSPSEGDRNAVRTTLKARASFRKVAISCAVEKNDHMEGRVSVRISLGEGDNTVPFSPCFSASSSSPESSSSPNNWLGQTS